MNSISNRCAVDRLGDVRAEIRRLKDEEDRLREWLIRHPEDLVGDEFVASVLPQTYERCDVSTARKALGALIAPFIRKSAGVRLAVQLKD